MKFTSSYINNKKYNKCKQYSKVKLKLKIGIQLTRIHREHPCLLLRPCGYGKIGVGVGEGVGEGGEVGEGVGVGGDREGKEVGGEEDEESRRTGETALESVRKRLA